MTYNVSSGTLNTAIPYHITLDLLIGDIGDDPERLLQLVFICISETISFTQYYGSMTAVTVNTQADWVLTMSYRNARLSEQ